jgi:hypothetical protein
LGDARAYLIPPAVQAVSYLLHVGVELLSGVARTVDGK